MSLGGLVAYGDSDDSDEETSDVEEENKQGDTAAKSRLDISEETTRVPDLGTGQEAPCSEENPTDQPGVIGTVDDIEDDELPVTFAATPFSVLKLPAPKHTACNDTHELFTPLPTRTPVEVAAADPMVPGGNVLDEGDVDSVLGKAHSFSLLGLPIPKPDTVKSSLTEMEEDEIEDEIKKKTLALKTKAEAPPKRHTRQPVKITIPELPTYDSDEDESPAKKRSKLTKPTQGGRTGLFSLLPSPKNFTVKTTNRPLLPHTLKRPAASPKPKPVRKPNPEPIKSLVAGMPDDDSEEEVEDAPEQSNFFSLGDGLRTKSTLPSLNTAPEVDEQPAQQVAPPPSLTGPWKNPTDVMDTVLGASLPASGDVIETHVPLKEGEGGAVDYQVPHSNADYNYANLSVQEEEPTDVQQYLQDEEFLKLAGRRQRGREQIDMIDVCGDHQTTQEELTRRITEEVVPGYSYSKKGKDVPSSQQRRKHQITYLAHQAKEREMELKNQWSQNRQSKRQTQAKYGF